MILVALVCWSLLACWVYRAYSMYMPLRGFESRTVSSWGSITVAWTDLALPVVLIGARLISIVLARQFAKRPAETFTRRFICATRTTFGRPIS
jgi:hypothetical protein